MIWHLPHIRALAGHWGSPITLLAKPRSAADQLFAAETTVAEVLWIDRNPERRHGLHDGPAGLLRLIRVLQAGRFQRAVLLHHSRTLAFAMMAARIPERYGYGFVAQRPFLNRAPRLPSPASRLHPYDQATLWLEALGIHLIDPEPRLPVAPEARASVRARLGPTDKPLVLFGIGSSEPYKQWGTDRFTALTKALAASGWPRFVLAGGVAESAMAEEIRTRLSGAAEIIPAIAWTLSELAALAAEAALYVGNDTGVMNLAAAVGIPSYGLFGATEPIRHASRIIPILPPDGCVSIRDGMARIEPETVLARIRADRGSLLPSVGPDALVARS
jgi:heptosyltransferase-2